MPDLAALLRPSFVGATARHWLHLGFAVILVQAVYWLLIAPQFNPQPRPVSQLPIATFEVATLGSPDAEGLRKATFTPSQMPWEHCCNAGYYAFRMTFDLDDVSEEGLGEVSHVHADNVFTYLNDTLLFGRGKLELDTVTMHTYGERSVHRLPAKLLEEGRNTLVYVVASPANSRGIYVHDPVIGAFDDVYESEWLQTFLRGEYRVFSVTVGLVVGVIALLGWIRGRQVPFLFWLGVVAISWSLSLLSLELSSLPIRPDIWVLGTVPITGLTPFAAANLANNWGPRRIPWLLPASAVLFVTGMVTFLAMAYSISAQRPPEWVVYGVALIFMLTFCALIVWNLPVIDKSRHWEAAIFLLLATITIVMTLGEIVGFGSGVPTNYAMPLLLLAIGMAFIARNIQLFRSAEDIATALQAKLDVRTAELEVAHGREKALLREQAHQDERRRIMADMHDGLGSNLMSMLLAARRGDTEPDRMVRGLQSAIDEMRLMIDSMDSVGESLPAALVLFRARAAERAQGAGFTLDWNDQSGGQLPELRPRPVLQVFRILQEALNNALKHSTGDTIRVTITPRTIALADNGSAVGKPRAGGRGIDNMAGRAQAIGGAFELRHRDGWTVAELSLPAPKPAQEDTENA